MRPHPHLKRSAALPALALLCTAVLLTGCRAQRTLKIRTNPPGAEIVLDQEILGPSPVTVEFYHYGARRITASMPNFRTHTEQVEIVPPW